jgi:hypothetical protein
MWNPDWVQYATLVLSLTTLVFNILTFLRLGEMGRDMHYNRNVVRDGMEEVSGRLAAIIAPKSEHGRAIRKRIKQEEE